MVNTEKARQRVAIATLHYGFNEGAILQAYCMAKSIESLADGITAEIIDQRYPEKVRVYGTPTTARTDALQSAIDHWLPVSEAKFYNDTHQLALEFVNRNMSGLVVGSDQVWALRFKRRLGGLVALQPGGMHPAFPNLYWPDNRLQVPKIAFAPSVGRLDWSTIPKRVKRKMKAILDEFELISARDERTLRFLEWISPAVANRAALVPDPTILWNLVNRDVQARVRDTLEGLGVDFSRRRCGIIAGQSNVTTEVVEKLKQQGVQTIAISYENPAAELTLCQHAFHPLEWANCFAAFDFCLSERMHACIFCIHNRVPFVALDINQVSHDQTTKLTDLLSKLDLHRYCVGKRKATARQVCGLLQELGTTPWNWKEVEEGLATQRETGLTFLRKSSMFPACTQSEGIEERVISINP